jgi:uncharacterized delta-60 repeat protein
MTHHHPLRKLILFALAALPLTALASGQPPVIVVNPTPTDCYVGSGCLDTLFGNSGKVMQDVGGRTDYAGRWELINAVAVQPDGMIVAAGGSRYTDTSFSWVIARFASDGTLDPLFGTAGITRVNLTVAIDHEEAFAIAIQPDGKILVAGWAGGVSPNFNAGVVRLDAFGNLDPTFGTNGQVLVPFGGGRTITAMKLQSDGKILVAADGSPSSSVARLQANGAVDTSFGNSGFRTITFKSGETRASVSSLALQSNGKILVGGTSYGTGSTGADFALRRLTTSGAFDTTFGSSGVTTTDFYGSGRADVMFTIAVASDDSFVAAGYTQPTASQYGDSDNMAFARYTSNGVLNTSFGSSGKVVLDMLGGLDEVKSIAIQADGKIAFTGHAQTPNWFNDLYGYRSYVIVGRLTSTGAVDTSYGASAGVTATAFTDHADQANAMIIDSNGMAVVAGYANPNINSGGQMYWALARYLR